VEEVRLKMETWGAVPNPLAHVQLDRGLATLEVRVQRQNASAQSLAEWAMRQRDIREVEWAGLPTHPDHALVEEWCKGPGSQVHLRLDEAHEAWRVAAYASEQLADTRGGRNVITRVSEGTEPGWLRVQVGLEPVDTIIAALISALTTTSLTSN
jgi:cystathionine beta-lyase/cystathionine gamma-synthase